jgi:hypothetical protein
MATKYPMKPIPGFKFGCDPEFFILNADGKIVSAHDLLPGTKDNPYKVDKGAIQVDGVAAEFNIDPAETFEEFDGNISTVMKTMLSMLPKGYKASVVPSVIFDEEEWARIPPSAKELGCMPDFNAWTESVNPAPRPTVERMRTASGHLHIGWTEGASLDDVQHIMNCNDLVKQLDWYLGGWSLSQDADKDRRILYGRAGACRYKPYGVEYRVLSNFWITTKSRRLSVWDRMQEGIWEMSNRYMPGKASSMANAMLINSINSSMRNPDLESNYVIPLLQIG